MRTLDRAAENEATGESIEMIQNDTIAQQNPAVELITVPRAIGEAPIIEVHTPPRTIMTTLLRPHRRAWPGLNARHTVPPEKWCWLFLT